MESSSPSDEYYNDPLAGHVNLNSRNTGNVATGGPSLPTVLSTVSTPGVQGTPVASDQRWTAYNRPGLNDHHKHSSTFEHEQNCTTAFSGLPPLSHAFNAYPQYPSRIASNSNYLDGPYPPHTSQNTVHMTPPHNVGVTPNSRVSQGPAPYNYTEASNGVTDMHGYFTASRSNDQMFSSNPHYINQSPQTAVVPSSATLTSTLNSNINSTPGTTLSSIPSNTQAYSSALDTRLPINGQPHRLSPAYPSMNHLNPEPLSTQHFWSNYPIHGHTIADRISSNNNFRSPSPMNIAKQLSSTPISAGVQLPCKTSNKVKQIYSFVPLPGAQTQKRPRRRYDEIERIYQCGWNGCEKAYGTLNHLNAHVFMQGHGEKRTPDEFREIRAVWRAKKKEEIKKKQVEEQVRQDEQKRHVLPSPQLNQQLSSVQEPQQSHSSNIPHVVYTHLPQPLSNVYPYPSSQQTSHSEPSHQHTYPASTYHTSLLPHLNQYTTQPQPYTNTNRDYKSHADEEDRDAEGEPDPETSG